jgi:CTP:molybdopterin cytidylyltransferase MocA
VTVAAVILAATPKSALADADGVPAVRRIADAAWSGGATPIVVVAADPDGAVSASLAGASVTLAGPPPAEAGTAGQIARGIDVAVAEIRELSAVLVWPAAMTWVGPETVTSLIEAHGTSSDDVLVPRFGDARGWPVLLPVSSGSAVRLAGRELTAAGVIDAVVATGRRSVELDLGDPGVIHDRTTSRAELPPYVGPVDPPAGHVHEWGAGLAETPDEAPLEGPALAPYEPAGAGDLAG